VKRIAESFVDLVKQISYNRRERRGREGRGGEKRRWKEDCKDSKDNELLLRVS